MRLAALLLVLIGGPALASPNSAVAAAVADCRQLPPGVREVTRYMDLSAVPERDRAELVKVVTFWANSLSRESELTAPRRVSQTLLAVTLFDYSWDAKTWEALADSEPYFSVRLVVKAGDKIRFWNRAQRAWYTRAEAKAVIAPAAAPWIDTAAITELILHTNSQVPIVRADWWAAQVAIAEGRKGTGYYDWIGNPKNLAEFEQLVGLDRKAAQRLKKEIQAVVQTSAVALHNRHAVRFPTLTGSYWETRDVKDNTDTKNALRLLNGDFKEVDALEVYSNSSNGLFFFFLANGKGERQNTAPDNIASDGRATGTDRRVHAAKSCVACHSEGIRPIDCWARKLYRGEIKLEVVDLAKYQRLRQLYLSDLDGHIRRDQEAYAVALKACNGLTPAENARSVAAVWDRYVEAMVGLEDICREMDVESDKLIAAIKGRASAGLADPILTGLLQKPPIPLVRNHLEELQPILWQTVGYKP